MQFPTILIIIIYYLIHQHAEGKSKRNLRIDGFPHLCATGCLRCKWMMIFSIKGAKNRSQHVSFFPFKVGKNERQSTTRCFFQSIENISENVCNSKTKIRILTINSLKWPHGSYDHFKLSMVRIRIAESVIRLHILRLCIRNCYIFIAFNFYIFCIFVVWYMEIYSYWRWNTRFAPF